MKINIDLYLFDLEEKTTDWDTPCDLTLTTPPVGAKVYGKNPIILEVNGVQYVVSGRQLAKALEALS